MNSQILKSIHPINLPLSMVQLTPINKIDDVVSLKSKGLEK